MKTIFSGTEPIFTAIFLMVISSIFLWGCNGEETEEDVKIVAHRGALSDRPENTMAAFRKAHELGADIIEIDLYTSSDGHLFILHDATLDRTTDGEGEATELTLEELQALDAGSWFGPDYAGERIPSFREVLEWATEEDVVLLLDLKESGPEFADNVAGDVQQYGVEENMVVGVRSPEQAGEFRERLPNARQLAFKGSPDDIEAYAEEGVDVLRLWLRWLDEDPTLADRVRQTGKKLMINGTLGELDETRSIMNFEPDWILIDDVVQFQESLRQIASNDENGITQTGRVNTGARHLVIVFDGLRADYITPDLMPNLYRLGQEGVVAENHHVVYPPVTRVNSPSLATGSYPVTHGLMHNIIYLPGISEQSIHTGNDVETLMAVDPLLTATSLGEWLDLHGLTFFAGSSGSYGSAYLLNHTELGAGVWNSRGFFAPEQNREHVLETFGDLPEITRPNYGQNRWVVDSWLTFAVDTYEAEASILWITDPDHTAHHYGIGAPETRVALRHIDDELGRLLNGLRERDLLDHTNVLVTTDHGFSTHTGGFDVTGILEEHELTDGVRIFGNTQIYVENQDPQQIEAIVRALQRDLYVGAIFTRPAEEGGTEGRVEGTMSTELIHYNHNRAADILVTAAWSDEENEYGYAGTSNQGGTAGHGTASPHELQVNLIASGPDFKNRVVSRVPAGNVDIAPTILHMLGLPIPESMDGRVLSELLIDGPEPESVDFHVDRYETAPVEWDDNFKMVLEMARTGESAYIHQARIDR